MEHIARQSPCKKQAGRSGTGMVDNRRLELKYQGRDSGVYSGDKRVPIVSGEWPDTVGTPGP